MGNNWVQTENNMDDDDDDDRWINWNNRGRRGRGIPVLYEKDDKKISEDIELKTRFINRLGINLFVSLPKSDKNIVICPLNLVSSLVILYIGSNGDTFFALRQYLGFDEFDDETVLTTLKDSLQLASNERYKLKPNYHLINQIRVLVDKISESSEKFNIWTKRYFNADIERIDFKRDGHLVGDRINQLIKKGLEDNQIKDFQTNINDKTKLVVMSAVIFKNNWLFKFPSDQITEADFYNEGVHKVKVKMMSITNYEGKAAFNRSWNADIASIPMYGESLVFWLILPKLPKGLPRLLKEFSLDLVEATVSMGHTRKCDLFLPQFTIDWDYDFAQTFKDLRVFTDDSEMAEIASNQKIKANNLLHKVVFEINETGHREHTGKKTPDPPLVIRADHPFIFIVQDVRTEAFLFIGKVSSLKAIDDSPTQDMSQ